MEVYKSVYGKYEVSNYGNVRNSKSGRILKPELDKCGYPVVTLCENNKRRLFKIHRLVAIAFIPNNENKPQIDHIDGDKTNSHYTNLRWVTPKENANNPITYKRLLANNKPPHKEKYPVLCIETGIIYEGLRAAERATNIPHSAISYCCKGRQSVAGGYHWRFA